MPEPSPAADPTTTVTGAEPTGTGPGYVTPYLLVMPTSDTAQAGMVWPGPEGKQAWAIPVTVPAGTRGLAVFLPLVQEATTPVSAEAASPAMPAPVEAERPAAPAPDVDTPAGGKAPSDADAPDGGGTSSATPAPATAASTAETPQRAAQPAVPQQMTSAGHQPAATWPAPPKYPVPLGATPLPPFTSFTPAPPRPSFFERHWRGPAPAKGWAVPGAVVAGALGLASFVPLGRVGIGWFVGWLTLTIGVVFAVRESVAGQPRTERWVRAGWAVAALALMSVLAFRNAWWLVTFCVLGALACAALAIVGGRLVRSILFSLVAAPIAAVRGLPWVRRHIAAPAKPAVIRRVTLSVVVTALVLIVFGTLLSSADAAFSVLLGELVPEIDSPGSLTSWVFLLAVGGLIAVAAVYTISAPPELSSMDKPGERTLGPVEWALPIGGLTLLFGGFVAVQFTVLFGGQRHVLRTAGLSYAEYARSGFWQLVAVTLLTLAVLGGVTRWARRDRPVERLLLRLLLGLLSALSVVIVVSALSRMYAYQKVYSFTGERIFVMASELLLGVIFVMIMAAGVKWRGAWIPRMTVALAAVMLLSLAVLNPEDYAARRNIARYQQSGKIDAWYLRALSADATPALVKLPPAVRRCTLSWIADDLAEPDPWYAWNLGRARARQELDRLGAGAIGGQKDCRKADQFDLPKGRR